MDEVVTRLVKYAFEGIVVAFAAYTIPSMKLDFTEILTIGMVAAMSFSLLDVFAPAMAGAARLGAGAGIGANLVGFPSQYSARSGNVPRL